MNWITKIIKAGEKIKSVIHKRATKEDIANSKLSDGRGFSLSKEQSDSFLESIAIDHLDEFCGVLIGKDG